MPQTVRVLPADVYDALEFSSLAFGGIGAKRYLEGRENWVFQRGELADHVPFCAWGHAGYLEDNIPAQSGIGGALGSVGINLDANDAAVHRINRRKNRAPNARVTFRQWARELNVRRGA